MRDWLSRALRARPELAAELYRRGMFSAREAHELFSARAGSLRRPPLGPVRFATLLADADTQLAARVVLRDLMRPDELAWLDRLLRFQESNDKRDELIRIVERAREGRKGNVRRSR